MHKKDQVSLPPDSEFRLPLSLLSRYLFFLSRRPISRSNAHYLRKRLSGLKTLGETLRNSGIEQVDLVVRHLESITTSNFRRFADKMQYSLLPFASTISEVPGDVLVTGSPPKDLFTDRTRTILLLLAPAIGVGDEVILFRLPEWIKAAAPQSRLKAVSGYEGIWERVAGVDEVTRYDSYADIVKILRGELLGKHDIVMVADFEKPNLAAAVCREPGVERYAELSLGTCSASVVDNPRKRLHRIRRPHYFQNFYAGLNHLARWMGLTPSLSERFRGVPVQRYADPSDERMEIFVSAFTSKYDPSPIYWSRLLCLLSKAAGERPVRFVLDRGTNFSTARFSEQVAVSAQARVGANVRFEVAGASKGRYPNLADVFSQIERSHVVVCSDSFAAHIAPLFECITLVLAAEGLENWRVPSRRSYYFDAAANSDAVAEGMREVLLTAWGKPAKRPFQSEMELRVDSATRRLARVMDNGRNGEIGTLLRVFEDFVGTFAEIASELGEDRSGSGMLFDDFSYADALTSYLGTLRASSQAPSNGDALNRDTFVHLEDHWQQWENTNLRKYLAMKAGRDSVGRPTRG